MDKTISAPLPPQPVFDDDRSARFSARSILSIHQFKMYQQIYFTVIAVLAVVVLIIFAFLHFVINPASRNTPAYATLAKVVGDSLPPLDAPQIAQASVIQDWISRTRSDIALYGPNRQLIFGGGQQILAAPPSSQIQDGWIPGDQDTYAAVLPDKRWLVVSLDSGDAARHVTIGAGLFSIFLLVGLGIYPVVRKITGRLEDLQRSVDELGGGKLSARVDIEGADEVGVLARSFNRTASQLETLVKAQKSLLANASHELRSPLARIQMALGLLGTDGANSAVEEINRSVHELDQLVGEILLTSRLESGEIIPSLQLESIDLATFLRDACAPYGAKVECAGLNVTGDRILMKRLLRNLLENAQRHGAGTPIEVSANKVGEGWVEISVGDRGPGVPVSERERIFDPFYRAAGAREGDGGMGVGLALVRSIAQLHRGTVYCGDRVGGGSIFVVRFPPI